MPEIPLFAIGDLGFFFLDDMQSWTNILLVADSGQNSVKTTFICELIAQLKDWKPISVKVSSHFYEPTPGLKELSLEPKFELYEETSRTTRKDSSLYLQHGASRSFYLQATDDALQAAFMALMPFLEADQPIIIEFAALHHVIDAGLFVLIIRENAEHRPSTEINRRIADLVVFSNGKSFNPQPKQLTFDGTWKINAS